MRETRHLLAKRRRRAHSAGVTTLLIRCTRTSPESNRGARQGALVGLRRGHAGPDAGDAAVRHPRPRRCRDPLAARHGDHPRLAGRRPAHDRRARTSPHPVAFLAAARLPGWQQTTVEETQKAASSLGIKLVVVEVQVGDYDRAFAAIRTGRADAVPVQGTVTFNRDRKRIIALAAKHQLPAIYEWRMAAISSSTRWPASPPDNSLFRSGNARALAVRRDCRAADREPVVAGAPA